MNIGLSIAQLDVQWDVRVSVFVGLDCQYCFVILSDDRFGFDVSKHVGDGCGSYDYCDVLVSINVGDGSASYDYCDVSSRD